MLECWRQKLKYVTMKCKSENEAEKLKINK